MQEKDYGVHSQVDYDIHLAVMSASGGMRTRCSRSGFLGIISFAALSCVAAATACAHGFVCNVALSGANEIPANNSPGTGTATITVDFDEFNMRVEVNFSGLQGTVTAAHIHAATPVPFSGTAIAATQTPSFAMFPSGGTSGTYDQLFDLRLSSSYSTEFLTAHGNDLSTASNALFAALAGGKAYLDIHTSAFEDGEIRGFLVGPRIVLTEISAALSGEQRDVAVKGSLIPSGSGVRLDRSSDLQNWEVVATTETDPENGEFSFSATEPSVTTRQFYRVIDLLEDDVAVRAGDKDR